MEEAWELAALGMAVNKSIDWSSRHTRLRYQAVVSSLAVLIVSVLGISELKLPLLFEVATQPNYTAVWLGLFLFAIFSIFSFYSQSLLEKLTSSSSVDEAVKHLKVTFALRPRYDEAKKHEPLEFSRSVVDSIIRSYNHDLEVSLEELNEISSNYKAMEVILENYLDDMERILFVFESEAKALFEELAFLSGKAALSWRFALSTASMMKRELDVLKQSVASLLSLAKQSVGDFNTIRATQLNTKIMKSSLDLHGSENILRNGIYRIVDFGTIIRADVKENLNAFENNTMLLSYRLPLVTSIFIIVIALSFSLRNALQFWDIL